MVNFVKNTRNAVGADDPLPTEPSREQDQIQRKQQRSGKQELVPTIIIPIRNPRHRSQHFRRNTDKQIMFVLSVIERKNERDIQRDRRMIIKYSPSLKDTHPDQRQMHTKIDNLTCCWL